MRRSIVSGPRNHPQLHPKTMKKCVVQLSPMLITERVVKMLQKCQLLERNLQASAMSNTSAPSLVHEEAPQQYKVVKSRLFPIEDKPITDVEKSKDDEDSSYTEVDDSDADPNYLPSDSEMEQHHSVILDFPPMKEVQETSSPTKAPPACTTKTVVSDKPTQSGLDILTATSSGGAVPCVKLPRLPKTLAAYEALLPKIDVPAYEEGIQQTVAPAVGKRQTQRYFCPYCRKDFAKLPVHVERVHKGEELVLRLSCLPKNVVERKRWSQPALQALQEAFHEYIGIYSKKLPGKAEIQLAMNEYSPLKGRNSQCEDCNTEF